MSAPILPILAPVVRALRDCHAYAMGGDLRLDERKLLEAETAEDARTQLCFMWRRNAVLSTETMDRMAEAWLALRTEAP